MNNTRSKAILLVMFVLFLAGCASKPVVHNNIIADTWTDARIVAEQSAIIAEQRATLSDMEGIIEQVRGDLERARDNLERAIAGAGSLREQWEAIDAFVRAIIEAERQLEALQPTN